MALARRHALPAAKEPLYEFQDIPRARKSLEGSCVLKIVDREEWVKALPELLLLCNEASLRNEISSKARYEKFILKEQTPSTTNKPDQSSDLNKKPPTLPLNFGKPLSLEYMADRIDLDDPLNGYVVRDKATGWIQGFITVTTFTTWQKWFRFDSLADEAGLLLFDQEGKGLESLHEMGMHLTGNLEKDRSIRKWWNERYVDGTGALAAALNSEIRDGDINSEGVIWPRIAELSLLGGLGCGSWLLQLLIEELEQPESPYNYLILQATDNSVPFYESQGFVRVGAVARYNKRDSKVLEANSGLRKNLSFNSKRTKPTPIQLKKSYDGINYEEIHTVDKSSEGSVSSPYRLYEVDSETQTIYDIACKMKSRANEILLFNRRQYPQITTVHTKLQCGTILRIPVYLNDVDPLGENIPHFPEPILSFETRNMVAYDGKAGTASSNHLWYTARDNETPTIIGKKLGLSPEQLCRTNSSTYPTIHQRAALQKGTILRIPDKRPIPLKLDEETLKLYERRSMKWVGVDELDEDESLTAPMCYRHWAFSDDPVELTHASYMMVRPLNKSRQHREGSKIEQVKRLLVSDAPKCFLYEISESSIREMDGKLTQESEPPEAPNPKKTINIILKSKQIKDKRVVLGPFCAYKPSFSSLGGLKTALSADNITFERRKRPSSMKRPRAPALSGGERTTTKIINCPLPIDMKLRAELDFPLKLSGGLKSGRKLFNTVVKLVPKQTKALRENFFENSRAVAKFKNLEEHRSKTVERYEEEPEYFYVLTYIPDLYWARLAPMEKDGRFDSSHAIFPGKDKWVLVPEGRANEIDVSASRCVAVRSRAVRRTKDADKEQWVIFP